jgi:flagellar motor switch protein FliM
VATHLDPQEISALMSAVDEGRVGPRREPAAVAAYDLTSQDRIIRGQMPTLDGVNEQTASLLAIGLSGRTRMSLEVTSSPATLQKFSDLALSSTSNNLLAILSLGQGHGLGLVLLEQPLPELLLAAALGDRKAPSSSAPPPQPRSGLTVVEQQVLRRLFTIFTDAMKTSWVEIIPFEPEILRFESDPRMAVIAPSSEVAISVTFDMTGEVQGRLRLIIPYAAVEPAKARLVSPPRARGAGDQRFAQALAAELQQVQVELRGVLGTASMRFQRLLELVVGDVIVLGADEASPIAVMVEGRAKLSGLPRISSGSLAIEVNRSLAAPDISLRNLTQA